MVDGGPTAFDGGLAVACVGLAVVMVAQCLGSGGKVMPHFNF